MMCDSNEEVEASTRGEWSVENLFPSDNVIVPTLVDESFWLRLVDKCPHVVATSFKDVNGNEWMEGDVVIRGFWYKQLFARSCSYTLHNDQPTTFVFSHLILAYKISMPPTSHVGKGSYATYELTYGVLKVILEALEAYRLLD